MNHNIRHRLKTGLALLCAMVMVFSVVPVYAEDDDIESIENKKSDLEAQLDSINEELLSISDEIETTEMQIEITNSEIARTEESLAEAKEKEEVQYTAMKSRIKYMYETGNASLLEMLFSAKDMTDFLNKADFIQNISEYDRDMIDELRSVLDEIQEKEDTLQEQQASLTTLQKTLSDRQEELNKKAEETSTDIEAFNAQLAQLRADEAARLAAESGSMIADGSGGAVINRGGISVAAGDVDILAGIIECETYQEYNSLLAVATVIMNRVSSSMFPNSISGVVYASGQFEPVWTGRLDAVLAKGPTALSYQVANDAINGARLSTVADCYYFLSSSYAASVGRGGVDVGGNRFFVSW